MKKGTVYYGHFIDHEHKTVIIGRDFLRRAGKYGSEQYNEYLSIKRDFPDYEIRISDYEKRKKHDL